MQVAGEGEEASPSPRPGEAAQKPELQEQAVESHAPVPHKVETGARQMFEAAKHDAEVRDPEVPAGTEMVKQTLSLIHI